MQPQPRQLVHRRVRRRLRRHTAPQIFSSRNHPVIKSNDRIAVVTQTANEQFDHDSNNDIQRLLENIDSQTERSIETQQSEGTNSILRKHITGRQRATIFFDERPFRSIASSNCCSLRTIHKIKACPLSALGLTWRQLKVILCDIQDSNLMNWFSNTNGIGDIVMPPVGFASRGGATGVFTVFHISILRFLLTHNPDLYPDEIKLVINFVDPSFDFSLSTLSRVLLKMGFDRKRPTRVIGQSDPLERHLFKLGIDQIATSIHQFVFFDESTNARGSLQRYTSRSPAKMQSLGSKPQSSLRVSVLLAINSTGIVDLNLIPGTVDRSSIGIFLLYFVLPKMNPFPQPNSILILDNARVHLIDDLVEYCWEHFNVVVIFLPPYSPDLNPIERVFGFAKACFKRLVGSYPQLRRTPYLLWLLALSQAQHVMHFDQLIHSTYNQNPDTGHIDVIVE